MANSTIPSDTSRGFLAWAGRVFAAKWFPLAATAIALSLTFRVVYNGLDLDDYFHRAVLSGSDRFEDKLPGPQGMFRFISGDPERAQGIMDIGILPWWTDPNIKAEFLQLIPTQSHILDYWLWPERPELMHVHSLFWFAVLILLVAWFYRRILGATWLAGVAVLLFAMEDGHGSPVGWICNRNTLIAASFGVGCLIAHDFWRRERKGGAFWVALLLWVLSLCSKEAGIATCAYVFAYALWLDESTLWQRFRTLVPYGVVLVVWRIVRDSLGFGVANIGFYVDPITDPGQFAMALLERYPVLLLGQWGIPSDFSVFHGELLGSRLWWLAVGYVCVLGFLFWPLLRRDRIARFFATGMLLSVIPICATFPQDRLLMFVGLGAFGLMVQFWNAVFAANGPRPSFVLWRAAAVPVAVLLALLHVLVAPFLLPARTAPFKWAQPFYVRGPFDETIVKQDLVVVNAPVPMFAAYGLFICEHDGMPVPRAVRTLAPGISAVHVRRSDDRTLEITPHAGYLNFPDNLFRNEQHRLQRGEQVHLPRMTATILRLTDDEHGGRPETVVFRFTKPLEDASFRWLRFHAGQYVPWTPPAVGKEVTLEPGWEPTLF
jgi:hypothetical protein